MYLFVNKLLGSLIGTIANKEGCPTIIGFIVHAVVFAAVFYMILKRQGF
jgi:hypothetical protein